MKGKLIIAVQSGGYAGWIVSDQGRQVQAVDLTASPDRVRETFELYMADPEYIQRLNKAWKTQGLTFNNLTV